MAGALTGRTAWPIGDSRRESTTRASGTVSATSRDTGTAQGPYYRFLVENDLAEAHCQDFERRGRDYSDGRDYGSTFSDHAAGLCLRRQLDRAQHDRHPARTSGKVNPGSCRSISPVRTNRRT